MRVWVLLAWLAGLAMAAGASWLVWQSAEIDDPKLQFAAVLAPVLLWAILPVLFARLLFHRDRSYETPKLRDQRRAALTFLAHRGLKGRSGRYSLPLYLVAGPPGSGKTSLVERSDTGIAMPITIGNSMWWVGKEAIFVEAATGPADAGIREVLKLIRSVRPKLPLNGTLLVVSPADLTLADKAEHRTIAHAIANELREVEEVAGVVAPVYLLLSKVDLVPGFREFFGWQEPQERADPWGFGLPHGGAQSPEDRNRQIEEGFQRILMAMRVRHVEWLSREADPVRCGRIQGFAAQISALRHAVRPILDALLPDQTNAWNGAVLRGIFLTSARQEPLSIDALLPELSRRFAMPRIGTLPPDLGLDEEEQGYFIGGTLKKAVFPEAGLALRERRHGLGNLIQWSMITVLVAASLGVTYFAFRAFDEEVRLAAKLSQAGAGIEAVPNPSTISDIPAVLARLRQLDVIAAEIDATSAPPAYTFGLSGRGRYAAALDAAKRDTRRNALAPLLAALLETQLVDPERNVAELQHLIKVVEDADEPESETLRVWLTEVTRSTADEEDQQLLLSEGLTALREAGGLAIDPAYVDAARRMIAYRESLS